jgi:ABC-2 type transport system permease protein
MFSSGNVQLFIRDLGLQSRYRSILKGLVDFSDLGYLSAIAVLFFILTRLVLEKKIKSPLPIIEIIVFVVLIFACYFFQIRTDWTKDKRYTLSQPAKTVLSAINSPIEMELYLNGNMNAGFTRLQKETLNTIEDFNRATKGKISVKTIDPYSIKGMVDDLNKQDIRGIAVNEKDVDGSLSQKILFPWLKIKYKDLETTIYLLVNQRGKSGEENLNTSIELLEYKLAHGIQVLTENKNRKIVFIEGHEELEEPYLEDITYQLSSSFQIDRGIMSNQLEQLDEYELVIVACPQLPYTEEEKYILDQYLMQGGRILWLINGVQLQSTDDLFSHSQTISRAKEVNLEDMLFKYGIRINPVLIQDIQCQNIPVNNDTVIESASTKYTLKPWYYAPLLIPNQNHPVTKNLPPIKSAFASSLSFTTSENINKQILLTSSEHTHLVRVPEIISLEETDRKPDATYFNESYLPVAALLEGEFSSVFQNRIPPASVETGNRTFRSSGKQTKMILIASEEVIRNDNDPGLSAGFKPLGYDPYSGVIYGNSDFITNAVGYLTDDSGLISLRNKTLSMSLLDKAKVRENRTALILWNVIFPPIIILAFFFLFSWRRNSKYTKK